MATEMMKKDFCLSIKISKMSGYVKRFDKT